MSDKTNTMRRTYNHPYQPIPRSTNSIEDENEEMTEELKNKISVLKSLTIEIGNEVKQHNKLLDSMGDDFERTGGFLGNTMNRVIRLGKGKHNYYICYILLFSLFVFFVLWITIR